MVLSKIVGCIAAFFNAVTFVPQVCKTWKTKSASDVSIQMFIISTTNALLWSIYGIGINDPIVYTVNTIVFFLSVIQIILKVKYDRADKK
jgi:MtN3 and saliva related transmembrane protein